MATDEARGKVIHEAQPFGFVRDHNMMGAGMNGRPFGGLPTTNHCVMSGTGVTTVRL